MGMQRSRCILAILVCALAIFARAETHKQVATVTTSERRPNVALFVAYGVTSNLVDGLVVAIARNLELKTRIEYLPRGTTARMASSDGKRLFASDIGGIFLDMRVDAVDPRIERVAGGKYAIVSSGISRTNDPPRNYPTQWRTERTVLHFLGTVIGVPECAFPLCAMHETDEPSDETYPVRDICPPCRIKAQRLLDSLPSQ